MWPFVTRHFPKCVATLEVMRLEVELALTVSQEVLMQPIQVVVLFTTLSTLVSTLRLFTFHSKMKQGTGQITERFFLDGIDSVLKCTFLHSMLFSPCKMRLLGIGFAQIYTRGVCRTAFPMAQAWESTGTDDKDAYKRKRTCYLQ